MLNITTCEHCGGQAVDGTCVEVMRLAFERVTGDDWRAPVDHIISFESTRDTAQAIAFYTATEATWEDVQPQNGIRMVRIQADGYRAGPAN